MTLSQYLSEVEARVKAATPGPWKADDCLHWVPNRDYADEYITGPTTWTCTEHKNSMGLAPQGAVDEAEFIAHAPTDLARLVAMVKEMQKALAHYSVIADRDGALGRDRRDVARETLSAVEKLAGGGE